MPSTPELEGKLEAGKIVLGGCELMPEDCHCDDCDYEWISVDKNFPSVVAAADWSKSSKKRWMAKAILQQDRYVIPPPERVENAKHLREDLRASAREPGHVLVGFDFPIVLRLRSCNSTLQ